MKEISMDNPIIILMQFILVMGLIFMMAFALKKWLSYQKEVLSHQQELKRQNQIIVSLLGKIHDELRYIRINKYTQTEKYSRTEKEKRG